MYQDVLEAISAWEALAWVALVIAVIVGIVKIMPRLRDFTAFLDGVSGKPARFGRPAEPGLFERLASIETKQKDTIAKLDVVNHELFPNSGKSLRDQTNRIEEKLDRDNDRISHIETLMEDHLPQASERDGRIENIEAILEEHLVVSNAIIEKLQQEES